jgi:hypothetical protein
MTKYDFERYKTYSPGISEFLILGIGLVVFIIPYILLLFNIDRIFNIFHYFIFCKDGDIIFSLNSSGIFMLSFSFAIIMIIINMLNIPFLFFDKFNGAYSWFKIIVTELKYEHGLTYRKYLFRRKIMIIILAVSLISSFFPLFIHLRISDDGIYFTKYLSCKENYYPYENIESVSVYLDIMRRNELSITPKAVIKFDKYEQNIWGWDDDPEKILRSITILIRNGVRMNLSNKFDESIMYELNSNFTQKKREDILLVFKRLEEIK